MDEQPDGMDEQPGLSDQYRMSSPWPLIVVFGFVLSELGVFLGILPVAVGGLLLLVGSVSGIVRESGYTERPWSLLWKLGAVLVVLGGVLAATQIQPLGLHEAVTAITTNFGTNGIRARGLAIAFAGLVAAVAGVAGSLVERDVI